MSAGHTPSLDRSTPQSPPHGTAESEGDPVAAAEGPISSRGEEVVPVIAAMITEVIGADYLLDVEITADTSFDADLDMESIEFVEVAERLEQRYGSRVDFVGWIAGLELEEIMEMSVGRLAEFVATCLE